MVRLQTPLADRYTLATPEELDEWIGEAKRDETRKKRVKTTLEWLAEGKSRNWKYERKPS